MALFYRIKEVKSINFFNHFKRFYFQIHTPRLSTNYTNSKTILDYNNYFQFANKNQGFRDSRVRFFAAPVQVVKTEEVKKLNRPRLNDEITADFVRLVTNEGHSVVSRREAERRAKELKFDLVEVDPNSKPPVCRLMDYHREMYNKKVKGKEKAKIKSAETLRKSACKEVRFSVKAELKDIKIKADNVIRLMERGYQVKCMALASEGRDLSGLLSKISALIEDVAFVEFGPKVDERKGYMIVRHIKFGTSKKGKKASKGLSHTKSGSQTKSSACSDGDADSEEQINAGESSIDYDNEDSDSDLDDEVKTPLQSKEGRSSRTSHDKQNKFDSRPSSTIRSDASTFTPSQAPNVRAVPQPENRYAKMVPNNASPGRNPVRSPNNGSQPQPQSYGFPPVVPRHAGSEGHPRPPSFTGNNTSKSTSFGLFSGAKADNGNIGGLFSGAKADNGNIGPGVHSNQQVTGKPTFRGNMNPPTSKSDGSPSGDDKKWGIFSGGNSVPGTKG